jgi:hypothetical protein
VALTVVLYGRSLILASVASRLEGNPRLRVVTLEGPPIEPALTSLDLDVLMVDLDAISVEQALALLDGRPDVLLVGLEASGARLLVLSGKHARSLGADDLVGLIDRRAAGVFAEP